jgi:hypothetical protein
MSFYLVTHAVEVRQPRPAAIGRKGAFDKANTGKHMMLRNRSLLTYTATRWEAVREMLTLSKKGVRE